MAGLPEIVRLLPIIIRLFPQLVRTTFYRGFIRIFGEVKPLSDEELARDLNRKIDTRSKDKDKDNQMVVKVKDAVHCVEVGFNETTLIKEFILVAIRSLIAGRGDEACGQRMFNQMSNCIREKALRHDTPRVIKETRQYRRPAKGHGKGRSSF
jgi:hypothetical protein